MVARESFTVQHINYTCTMFGRLDLSWRLDTHGVAFQVENVWDSLDIVKKLLGYYEPRDFLPTSPQLSKIASNLLNQPQIVLLRTFDQ